MNRLYGLLSGPRFLVWSALALILVVGAWLRLAGLNECSLYMDSQDFLTPCREGLSPAHIFSHWEELPTGKNHLPFPVAWTQAFLQTFRLPLTFANLILPSAIWGFLVIPVAWAVGREIRGNVLGLVLATITALQPIYIQLSRHAYYYAPSLLGAMLSVWALLLVLRPLQGKPVPIAFYFVNAASVFLMLYSDGSMWAFSLLVAVCICGFLAFRSIRDKSLRTVLVTTVVLYLALGLPILLSSWGYSSVRRAVDPEARRFTIEVLRQRRNSPWPLLMPVLGSYAWGTTLFRGAFSVLIACMGVLVTTRMSRDDRRLTFLMPLLVVGLGITMAMFVQTTAGFSHSRVLCVTPLLLVLLALGLTGPTVLLTKKIGAGHRGGLLSAVLLLLATALLGVPAYLCTRSTGSPAPYIAATAWLDANLPADTPILTERFFDAFNEYRVHPATNVVFMSTVRNQSTPEYLGNGFRERSEAFLTRNPVSAVAQSRLLWDDPTIGPWMWPETFFARRIAFTNEAGLKLHRLGLTDLSISNNSDQERGYIRTFLYNLPEDVVARARRAKQPLVAFFGVGWKYVKTQDYRDWRLLTDQATLEAHNLTTERLSCQFVLRGVAVNGTKRVSVSSGGTCSFEDQKLGDYTLGPFVLPPGSSRLVLTDPGWSKNKTILLVESLTCRKTTDVSNRTEAGTAFRP